MTYQEKLKELDKLRFKKKATFSLSDESRDELVDGIEKDSLGDVKGLSKIRKLCQTDKTKENSLGDIYLYLEDRKICLECQGKLSLCPKKRPGYVLTPVYDKSLDQIRTEVLPCVYQKEIDKALSNIRPADIKRGIIYNNCQLLLDTLKKGDNLLKMKDTAKALMMTKDAINSFSKDKSNKGIVFFSKQSPEISNRLLCLTAFTGGKKGLKTSYIKADDLFLSLLDRDYYLKEKALADYDTAKNSQCLILENIEKLPRFDFSVFDDYLLPLLKSRLEKGRITFFSLETPHTLSSTVGSYFSKSANKNEAMEISEKLAAEIKIKDLIL